MSDSQTVPKIKALPKEVVDKIAAGEVIQRPCNAIKELLENCLDAGAKSVSILYHQGGLKLIQITDNGHGIAVEDMDIVCRRHTTSKLSTFEDLRSIATFGFRGEALASISHIAHVTITSKTEEQQCAYKAEYSDGELKVDPNTKQPIKPAPCAGVRGTTIKVEDLFYNIGTRKSGMANHADEARRIADVVTKYALHSTGVSISLKKQGETKADVHTPQSQSVVDNIKNLYGAKLAKEILTLEYENEALEYSVKAHFTNPNYHEKKSQFVLFINKRLVENKNLKKALSSVFENYIPKGTHPFIFVSMMMNPKKIDVNVHPTKEEVIFLREEEIIAELKEKVREKLLSSDNSRVFVAQTTTALKSKVALASGQSLPPTLTKPQSLDRTDVVDKQQGAMELYLDSSKKRPNTTEPVVPRKKQKLDTHELTSVQNILNDFEEQEHEALKKMFKDATFVGCASAEISLVQYETKLYALNMRNVSSAFMFQFAKQKKLTLKNPIDVMAMLEAAAKDKAPIDMLNILTERAEMLDEYFAIQIQDRKLLAIPQLLENYVPPLHRLPSLLVGVAEALQIEEEADCLQSLGAEVALFNSTCQEWELVDSEETEHSHGVSQQQLYWIMQHILFPALRVYFKPPEDFTADGTVMEVASLSELYQSFERC